MPPKNHQVWESSSGEPRITVSESKNKRVLVRASFFCGYCHPYNVLTNLLSDGGQAGIDMTAMAHRQKQVPLKNQGDFNNNLRIRKQ
jgi:hypothetical protein